MPLKYILSPPQMLYGMQWDGDIIPNQHGKLNQKAVDVLYQKQLNYACSFRTRQD